MSDPRLTAAQLNEYLAGFLALRDAGIEIDDAGQEMESMVRELIALRADVDRLTAERDALQQRILGMEDRLDIVTAEDAMKKIAQGGTLHNADGSQRWCWCSTLQAVGTGSAKCPPCLARDIARLTAENAALREERDRETDEFVFAADESERVRLEAERDALKAELLSPLEWREGATIEKAERELAEARAEMARLTQERDTYFDLSMKNGTAEAKAEGVEIGRAEEYARWKQMYGGYLTVHDLALPAPPAETKTCAPMEDWRGANEDRRKR